jgi:hypothetical protein
MPAAPPPLLFGEFWYIEVSRLAGITAVPGVAPYDIVPGNKHDAIANHIRRFMWSFVLSRFLGLEH